MSFNRRDFLETSIAGGALAGLAALPEVAYAAPEPPKIAVYTGAMSCLPGEKLALHVSTTLPKFSATITRVGAKPRVVWQKEALVAGNHPTPADASLNGCHWPAALDVPIGDDWRSGIYLLKLQGEGAATETFFIVRAAKPGTQAKILFQLSTNTYQAYNGWGGTNLYCGPTAPRVSFNRPFNITPAVTGPVSGFYNPNDACYRTWDEPFVIWAEQSGYEMDYCANLDLEFQPDLLKNYRLVLSVGHDEYWSAGMRDKLEAYIGNGGNAGFLSGNSVCWQVRVEDDGRALRCYKRAHHLDPVFSTDDRSNLTTLWSDPLVGRPETQLTGVGYPYGGYNGFFGEYVTGPGAGEYTVHRPDHWLLAGTGLQKDETFGRLEPTGPQPGVAGYECDGCEFIWRDGVPVPTGRDGTPDTMRIVATAPARWSKVDGSINFATEVRSALPKPAADLVLPEDITTRPGAAVLGIYERGGTVVTTGSCGFTYGLQARNHTVDRIVRNLLDRLSV
jgi:hypothetical protein